MQPDVKIIALECQCVIKSCLFQYVIMNGGTWVVQSIKHLTLDFGSGHDLMVHEIEPHIRLCADSLLGILSLSLSLTLSQIKTFKNF